MIGVAVCQQRATYIGRVESLCFDILQQLFRVYRRAGIDQRQIVAVPDQIYCAIVSIAECITGIATGDDMDTVIYFHCIYTSLRAYYNDVENRLKDYYYNISTINAQTPLNIDKKYKAMCRIYEKR